MIPIRTDSPLRSTPWTNILLIAINVIVFVVQQAYPSLEARFALSPRHPQLLHYLTYAFLHANIPHVLFNMIFLYTFGNNVNDKMGNFGYLAFYLAGGIFAGVAYVVTQATPAGVVGASGAVAAVTGAYLVLFPRSNITVLYIFFFIGQFEIPSLYFILFFFGQDLFLNFAGDSHVAHMAHIGGTIFGVGICFAMLVGQLLPRDQFDVLALLQRWNKRRQYRDMVAKGYDPFGYAGPEASRGPPDPNVLRIQDLRAQISNAIGRHNLTEAAKQYLELKRLDPQQVLSRQAQLDVANQLASEQFYPQAADAYEQFLKTFPNFDQIEQVQLMLGIIYARYLNQYDRAKECLIRATAKLHGDRELTMARTELARIEPYLAKA
jgi:membrane associated rhomboid family serine protease